MLGLIFCHRMAGQMTAEQRVLLVTYHFPPDQEVGALRGEKFVKHLPEYGWRPQVLTVDPRCYGFTGTASPLRGVERTAVWPNLRDAYRAARTLAVRRAPGDPKDASFEEQDRQAPGPVAALKRTLRSLLCWPDHAVGWWPPAVLASRRLMRQARYEALITTGPPHIAHLVGLALSRRDVRWIVDLRDPWVDNPGKPRSARSGISDELDRRSERAVLTRAAAIIVGTDRFRLEIVRRYPELSSRVHVIPAGVDPDDFSGISRVPARKFTVAHFGELYYRRSPEPLFAGLSTLVHEGAVRRDELEIILAGEIRDGIDATALAERAGLAELVRLPGLLPRRQALQLMASSGALVLLAQAQPLQLPAKAFEYWAAGPPIIAVTGDGATSDFIRETNAGWVVAPDDAGGMRAALLSAYRDWRGRWDGTPGARPVLDQRFDRRELTGRLATLLEGTRP